MSRLLVLVMLACAACNGDDDVGSCPLGGEVDADELYERCVATCRAAIGCADVYNDPDTNEWVCELEPGCRTGLSPQDAFQEMFECDGTCAELRASSRGPGPCPAISDAIVTCFEALTCTAYEDAKPTVAMDAECASELDCLGPADCFQ